MFQNWYNFNEDKSINAFAFPEISREDSQRDGTIFIRRKVIMNIK
jgi:hypothetical protein